MTEQEQTSFCKMCGTQLPEHWMTLCKRCYAKEKNPETPSATGGACCWAVIAANRQAFCPANSPCHYVDDF